MPDSECLLGFDYGLKRTGVAVGQGITGTASPLQVLNSKSADFYSLIQGLIQRWRPDRLVVGLPLNRDGSDSEMSVAARKFGTELGRRFQLPVEMQDERLSTAAAQQRFAALRQQGQARRKDHRRRDAVAAQIILESWMRETYH